MAYKEDKNPLTGKGKRHQNAQMKTIESKSTISPQIDIPVEELDRKAEEMYGTMLFENLGAQQQDTIIESFEQEEQRNEKLEEFLEYGIHYQDFDEDNIKLIMNYLLEDTDWAIKNIEIGHSDKQKWWADIFLTDKVDFGNLSDEIKSLNNLYEKVNNSGVFAYTNLTIYGATSLKVSPHD